MYFSILKFLLQTFSYYYLLWITITLTMTMKHLMKSLGIIRMKH